MKLADYAPPSSPSLDQQWDALQKGLGRAFQWAEARRLHDSVLLAACLRDLRYDRQFEPPRTDWLWRMVQAAGAVEPFRGPILHALHELADDRSAWQLCALAGHYAATGDDAFRTRLYQIVEQKPFADDRGLGEDEIVELDGEAGFVFAARSRGRGLPNREWEWDDDSLVRDAIERFGQSRVEELLSNAADPALASFREGWHRQRDAEVEDEPQAPYRERMRAISVQQLFAEAAQYEGDFGVFRGWGIHADDADLDRVLVHLLTAQEPRAITNLLRVFSMRAAPRFDARLLDLCRHGDAVVRRAAFAALENIHHPRVRAFARAEIQRGTHTGAVVGLLAENYRPGDEHWLLETLEPPDDDDEFHWLLMGIIDVLKRNPDADCSRLGVLIYATTPCEKCRYQAARLLHDANMAPGWLAGECRHDTGERTRALFAEPA